MNTRKKVFGILSIVVMTLIFLFSARNAEKSTEDSLRVGMAIGRLVVPGFDELDEDEKVDYAISIDHRVRKTAHFLEYTGLGMMLLGFFYDRDKKKWKYICAAFFVGAFYAVTDEFHQMFVPGRACQAFDVMIDSAGVLTGSVIALMVSFLLIKAMQKKCIKNN